MNLRKHIAVIVWLALVAACVLVISRSQFTADMSAFMPRDPTPTQKIMVEQLRDGVVSRLILIGVDGAPAPVLAQLSKGLAAQLRASPELAAVNNGEQVGMEKDFQLLWKQPLSAERCGHPATLYPRRLAARACPAISICWARR